jgi:hypothetical protein
MVSFQKLCLLSLCSLIANARVSHGFVPSASQKRASGASQLVSPAGKELVIFTQLRLFLFVGY